MSDNHRTICWITPDYFLSVDAKIVPALATHYDLRWILINTPESNRTSEGLVSDTFAPRTFRLRYRQRDPRVIGDYVRLLSSLRETGCDLLYTSFHGLPYFFPVLSAMIDADKIIYGVHNVHTPRGATHEHLMRLYQRYAFSKLKRFQVFSKSQLQVISALLPTKQHYLCSTCSRRLMALRVCARRRTSYVFCSLGTLDVIKGSTC